MRKTSANASSARYEQANELAIDLIARSGYSGPTDVDDTGNFVGEELQNELIGVMLRSPNLYGLLETLVDSKPRKPHAITLRAFNLWRGAVFVRADNSVWVIKTFTDLLNEEQVLIEASRLDTDAQSPLTRHWLFDYMEPVSVVGNSRNPHDPDDTDWGA